MCMIKSRVAYALFPCASFTALVFPISCVIVNSSAKSAHRPAFSSRSQSEVHTPCKKAAPRRVTEARARARRPLGVPRDVGVRRGHGRRVPRAHAQVRHLPRGAPHRDRLAAAQLPAARALARAVPLLLLPGGAAVARGPSCRGGAHALLSGLSLFASTGPLRSALPAPGSRLAEAASCREYPRTVAASRAMYAEQQLAMPACCAVRC